MKRMSDPRILFVGGLHDDVTEEILLGAFSIFGEIVSVDLPLDVQTSKHRGFAIIEFLTLDDAREAIDNMDASELFGRTIRVKVSSKRSTVQLRDPKKAVWADEIYFRKIAPQSLAQSE
jgi:peptidyl-prolyl isomerase E (cyclophilin E)